jgi:hypothetical protein
MNVSPELRRQLSEAVIRGDRALAKELTKQAFKASTFVDVQRLRLRVVGRS